MFEAISRIQLTFFDIIMQMVAPFVDLILHKQIKELEELERDAAHLNELRTQMPNFKPTSIFKNLNETFYSLKLELDKHGK